ncbi:unnamed protein product [Kuraishia capsulata CBS 1993]|uniref:Cyclin N-terminal domain-containing protein n=1 Tax=Kuraishia capsulata CBS 1993 TaxID=1382522 RepID=W6MGU7_9ASCO|nr:uncharacterized protein KUCA_T00001384001 [Kuraishia capsulata CBS 1993]CDK25414.1 unnamed protein product [Kuraishia capsulata CBS 1993]
MSDSQALSIFLKSPVSQEMIHHLVVATLQVIPDKTETAYPLSPPHSPKKNSKERVLPSLMTFITKLVRYTNVYTGTLMSTLVYLEKLKAKLPQDAQALPCTRHRIFLACLILSAKYHNDSSPKNKHWTRATEGFFSREDVNLMERQLLYLLDWDLKVEEKDLIPTLSRFLEPIKNDIRRSAKIRRSLLIQKQRQNHIHHRSSSFSYAMPSLSSSNSSSSVATTVSSQNSSYGSSPSAPYESHSRSSSVCSTLSSYSSSSEYEYQTPVVQRSNLPHSNAIKTGLNNHVVILGEPALDEVVAREEHQLETLMRQYCTSTY